MEQRITRAKARVAKADIPFETPSPAERAERFAAVAAMIYLIFNEGYSAGEGIARGELCGEAIRLVRLLLRLFQTEPEIMGLAALLAPLQHARTGARFDASGDIILLEDQDRSLWDRKMIAEGLALIDKGRCATASFGTLSDPGRHRRPACARRESERHGLGRDRRALWSARTLPAFSRGDAQPRRRGREASRGRSLRSR